MENTKTREQSVDTDPMYDNREVVTDAEAEMEREQPAVGVGRVFGLGAGADR